MGKRFKRRARRDNAPRSVSSSGFSVAHYAAPIPAGLRQGVEKFAIVVDKKARQANKKKLVLQYKKVATVMALPAQNLVLIFPLVGVGIEFLGVGNAGSRAFGLTSIGSYSIESAPASFSIRFQKKPPYGQNSAGLLGACTIFENSNTKFDYASLVGDLEFDVDVSPYLSMLNTFIAFQKEVAYTEATTIGLWSVRDHHCGNYLADFIGSYPLSTKLYGTDVDTGEVYVFNASAFNISSTTSTLYKDKLFFAPTEDYSQAALYHYVRLSVLLEALAYQLRPVKDSSVNVLVPLELSDEIPEAPQSFVIPGLSRQLIITISFTNRDIPEKSELLVQDIDPPYDVYTYVIKEYELDETATRLTPTLAYILYRTPIADYLYSPALLLEHYPTGWDTSVIGGESTYGPSIRFTSVDAETDCTTSDNRTYREDGTPDPQVPYNKTTTCFISSAASITSSTRLDYDVGPVSHSLSIGDFSVCRVSNSSRTTSYIDRYGQSVTDSSSVKIDQITSFYKTTFVLNQTTTQSGSGVQNSVTEGANTYTSTETETFSGPLPNGAGSFDVFFTINGNSIVGNEDIQVVDGLVTTPSGVLAGGEIISVPSGSDLGAIRSRVVVFPHWAPEVAGVRLTTANSGFVTGTYQGGSGGGASITYNETSTASSIRVGNDAIRARSGVVSVPVWHSELPYISAGIITIYLVNLDYEQLGHCKIQMESSLRDALLTYMDSWAAWLEELNDALGDPGFEFATDPTVDANYQELAVLLAAHTVYNDFMTPALLGAWLTYVGSGLPTVSFIVYNGDL